MKKESKSKKAERIMRKAENTVNNTSAKDDPLGSYTGRPKDVDDTPVQDADDL